MPAHASATEVGEAKSLRRSRCRLEALVRREVSRLGDGRRCYLGGASQGCTMALDIYLRLAQELKLGGFVGSVGFLPTESKGLGKEKHPKWSRGFYGSNRALRRLLEDDEQAGMEDTCASNGRHAIEIHLTRVLLSCAPGDMFIVYIIYIIHACLYVVRVEM